MSNSTVYDVRVRYALEDKARAGIGALGREADKTASSLGGVTSQLKGVFLAAGGYTALSLGKKFLIDYNAELESMNIGLATAMSLSKGIDFSDAEKQASGLFDQFQEMAKKSPATTRDFVEMANAIGTVAYSMGATNEEMRKLTGGAITAGAALYGGRYAVAQTDINQMLGGRVGIRDQGALALLKSQGLGAEQFNAMSEDERLKTMLKIFDSPKLAAAAERFGQSFTGQVSTFKDTLQLTLAKVGLPLFKSITEEVKKWNTWIEKNPEKIQEFAQKFTTALKDGFQIVKQVAGFISEHKDMIMLLAKALLIYKGAQLVHNMGYGIVQAMTQAAPGIGGQIGAAMAVAGMAFMLGAKGMEASMDDAAAVEIRKADVRKLEVELNHLKKSMVMSNAKQTEQWANYAYKQASEMGLYDKGGKVNQERLYQVRPMTDNTGLSAWLEQAYKHQTIITQQQETVKQFQAEALKTMLLGKQIEIQERLKTVAAWQEANAKSAEYFLDVFRVVSGNLVTDGNSVLNRLKGNLFMGAEKKKAPKIHADVKVEVYSDDPDRFAPRLVKGIELAFRNPGQARDVITGGQ